MIDDDIERGETAQGIKPAQPVAAALDASHWPEVVGTIAGDDTVLVIASDKKKAQTLAGRIGELA